MTAVAALSPAMNLMIRPFTGSDADYAAVIAVEDSVYPDHANTLEEWRHWDATRDPKVRWGRFVAEENGKVVGYGNYGQEIDMFHPRKFHIRISVRPEAEGRGIGSRLYTRLEESLAPFDPILIRARAQEDRPRGVAFLTDHGFIEEMRDWESRLHVAPFDPAPFGAALERVASQNIVIKSLYELADDPERDRKLYELDWEITRDMPSPDTLTKPTFAQFHKHIFESPNFLPEGWYIALDGDRYVGESSLWKNLAAGDLNVGATGVLREYRRRGIALALKLHAIAYARSMGHPRIKTWNATTNRPMLAINEALGFVKQPAWINYAKTIKTEEAAIA